MRYLCTELTEIWDLWSFTSYSCNKPKKWSNELRTRFVILVHCTHTDIRIFQVLPHTAVISHKMVKWAESTICDTCALNLRRYDIFQVLPHTVVIGLKTVKWANNTICDTCALNSLKYEIFQLFTTYSCNKH